MVILVSGENMKDWGYAYIYNPTCPPDKPYTYEEYKYDKEKEKWITTRRIPCTDHYNDY